MQEITFIIHTFKRPQQLLALQESIQKFYPQVDVIVYDDSEFDRGLSWGRNHLVEQVETPYFLLLDDDFIFTANTDINKLKTRLLRGYDVVAGSIVEKGIKRHYEGRYSLTEGVLRYIPSTTEPLDFVFNFFLGRTETFRTVKWDEELKLAEHTAFFLANKGKLKIGYVEEVEIEHHPYKEGEYKKYRHRAYKYMDLFMRKYGIDAIEQYDGSGTYKLGDYLTEKKYEL